MKILEFPKDFIKRDHPIAQGGVQYIDSEDTTISIVGGAKGLYGITTFEMWDYREADVRGHLTIEQINEHLRNNPL